MEKKQLSQLIDILIAISILMRIVFVINYTAAFGNAVLDAINEDKTGLSTSMIL